LLVEGIILKKLFIVLHECFCYIKIVFFCITNTNIFIYLQDSIKLIYIWTELR